MQIRLASLSASIILFFAVAHCYPTTAEELVLSKRLQARSALPSIFDNVRDWLTGKSQPVEPGSNAQQPKPIANEAASVELTPGYSIVQYLGLKDGDIIEMAREPPPNWPVGGRSVKVIHSPTNVQLEGSTHEFTEDGMYVPRGSFAASRNGGPLVPYTSEARLARGDRIIIQNARAGKADWLKVSTKPGPDQIFLFPDPIAQTIETSLGDMTSESLKGRPDQSLEGGDFGPAKPRTSTEEANGDGKL